MDLISELETLGVNTNEAIERFNKNTALYIKMLGKFISASADLEVMSFMESGDLDKAVANAHTLKGVTGNLSLTPLYKAYTDIVALLRANDPVKAKQILSDILPVQSDIVACIEKYQ